MAFDRITQDEISQNGVVSAPDKLTGTAADNKAIFDKLIKNIVAREFNKLLDDLEAANGAASIGAAPFDGVEGKNIQDQLKNVQSNVSTSFDGTTINGHKIPGTVVITKGDIGLGKVDNTSDMEKPVSSPQRSYVESVARDFILGQLPVPLPITQGGTNADTPQEALANLGAGVRPNLLDNGDFRAGHVVNQRGQTSISKPDLLNDRWRIYRYASGTATLTDNGINLTGDFDFGQTIESSRLPNTPNIPVTISALFSDGTFVSKTSVLNNNGELETIAAPVSSNVHLAFIRNWNEGGKNIDLLFFWISNGSITPVAAKLETGSTQTLAYHKSDGKWELLPQPESKPGQMLAECQRYLYSPYYGAFPTAPVGTVFVSNQTTGFVAINTPALMRTKPVFSGDPAKLWIVKSNGGGAQKPSALSVMGMSGCGVLLSVTASFEDGGQYIMYSEDVSNPSDFLLSAEL